MPVASRWSAAPRRSARRRLRRAAKPAGKTEVSAVSVREAPDRAGLLTGSTLKSKPSELKLTEPGKGAQQSGVTSPVVISADGGMASTSSAVIVGDVMEGPEVGLKAAPCLAPATSHWFSGLGATDADRTDLILSNPDDAQAQVDLRFYGRSGRVPVPGSPGVLIRGHESRTVSLSSLVEAEGALSVAVQASQGRVTAVAKRSQTNQLKAAGVDWQIPSASPSTVVVIPGVPEGAGRPPAGRHQSRCYPGERGGAGSRTSRDRTSRAEPSRSTFHLRALQR